MKGFLKKITNGQKGQGMVEYILIIAIIVAVIIAVFAILKPQIEKSAADATNGGSQVTNVVTPVPTLKLTNK
ncbi:MAG: hypothetical protein A2Y33_12520 [Spirochaetes bacterium GWF1_51_8]|nr:MAG: hypothetical protein A2Y33_12520 [Spirochaetes bacterium GWF1_51_8]